ncbi:MAG: hypothetical protein PHI35_05515 [Victivallaceae bacterium]|nr:hypothetical protein [Victivallaceae bacterium]
MTRFQKIICAAVLLPMSVIAADKAGNDIFTKIKVTPRFVDAPAFRESSVAVSGTVSFINSWLLLEVEYYPDTYARAKNAWIDDVTMKMRVLISSPIRASEKNKSIDSDKKTAATKKVTPPADSRDQITVLFDGETMFQTIARDNKKHIATMFIPPQLLDRHLYKNTLTGKLTTRDISVEVTFVNSAGAVIGEHFYGSKTDGDTKKEFERLDSIKNLIRLPGSVLPRSETPWGLIQPDKFDLIKQRAAKQ